ncbi:MAG: hypothetical protein IJW40_07105 [Clostridia bacterium]|nr:hypothetical protein [Clostridia bacterium]
MKDYLWQLLAFAAVCGVGGHLLPGGESGGFGKQWRLLCGVCMTLLLVNPILTLANNGRTLSDTVRDFLTSLEEDAASYDAPLGQEQSSLQLDANLAAYSIEQGLCAAFSIKAEEITVGVRLQETGVTIEAVSVGLSGSAVWKDAHAIEEWIVTYVGCDAMVYIK